MTEPLSRIPSKERGCDGKINLGRDYVANAERLSRKHGKRYGVYRCPHCNGYHVTTKLHSNNMDKYEPLLYVTDRRLVDDKEVDTLQEAD